jgi:hypothetical protein
VLPVVAAVIIAWLVAVALFLLRVDRHVRDGVAAVSAAQGSLNASTISDPKSPDVLAPVVRAFGAAHRDLDSPLLAPLRIVPIAGRQLRAIRNLANAAEQVGSIGEGAITHARAALRAPHGTGPQRVAAIEALAGAASDADVRLAHVSLGSRSHLIGAITRRYDDFATRLARVRTGVHKGAIAATQTAALLRGPSQLLLLAANNAEMRNGSGMFLSLTQVDVTNGTLKIGRVYDSGDLQLPAGAVPLSGGYATVWGDYLADQDWRNLALSARFDETAALAARMWKAKTGVDVQGVLSLDIAGVQMLLEGTGPVYTAGMDVTPSNVVQFLMHDQYLGPGVNTTRHDDLGQIAQAVVQAVQRGGFDTAAVGKALPSVVAGRHLMLWSADPSTETGWVTAGVSGALADNTLLVGVQNMGANKLDRFLTFSSDVRVAPGPLTKVTVVFHLTNAVPPGQPSYIDGSGTAGVPPGTYYALDTLTMPVAAGNVLVDGAPVANNSGTDGPTRVVATLRKIPAGGKSDVTVTFTLPGAHGRLQVEGSGRVPAATVRVHQDGPERTTAEDERPVIAW